MDKTVRSLSASAAFDMNLTLAIPIQGWQP